MCKRLSLALVVLLVWCAPAQAAITLLAHTSACNASGSGVPAVTSAIDTTGASLLLIASGGFVHGSLTDNVGNTFAALTDYSEASGSQPRAKFYYATTPNTSAAYVLTSTTGGDTCIAVLALSGSDGFDSGKDSGATSSGNTSIQPGSLTPSAAGSLVVTSFTRTLGTAAAIAGYTIIETPAGGAYKFNLAYQIQGAATATNPTWNIAPAADQLATNIAVFLATGGVGGGGAPPRRPCCLGVF